MSSFFTVPASQRKRKREDSATVPSKDRTANKRSKPRTQNNKSTRPKRDDSISSSGSEGDTKRRRLDEEEEVSSSDSDDEDETGAERRLRLAERYLENIKGEVDEVGFDAEEIDKDLIAERLQEDVVCVKGFFLPAVAESKYQIGRDQRKTLPAYSLGPFPPKRNKNPVPCRHLDNDLNCRLSPLRLHRLKRPNSH